MLKVKEFYDAPPLVQHIYMCALMDQPIGSAMYDEAIEKHPGYFPDIVEYRKKWKAIPQEVHDAYWVEFHAIEVESLKDVPHAGKGILYYIDNPKEYEDYRKAYKAVREKMLPIHKQLHEKFYAKYGIEWNGI